MKKQFTIRSGSYEFIIVPYAVNHVSLYVFDCDILRDDMEKTFPSVTEAVKYVNNWIE